MNEEGAQMTGVSPIESNVDVLVVDDETRHPALNPKNSELENFSVKTAQDGEEALRLIKKRGVFPRLILLDVMMPKMDGFSVLQILKSDEKYASIKVVLFTVKSFTKDYDRARSLRRMDTLPNLLVETNSLNISAKN